MSAPAVSVKTIIDEASMTPRRWAVIAACFVIALLDGFDTQSIAFVGPSIAKDFSLTTSQLTWVITGSTIGMAVGAAALGSMGDRIGRKKTLLLALVVFGLFSVLGALASAPWQIVVLRIVIGVGIGGATPALLALAAEYSSQRARGVAMTLVLLGLPGGALLGGVVAAAWLPVLGWRGMFLLGGVLPLLMLLLLAVIPESPSFLVSRPGAESQRRATSILRRFTGARIPEGAVFAPEDTRQPAGSVKGLFTPSHRTDTVAISVVYFAHWISWFLLLQWMPSALHELGLSEARAAAGTVIVNGAFIVFSFPVSAALTRVRAKTLLLVMFGCGVVTAIGLAASGSSWGPTFALIAVAGFSIGGQQLVLNVLIAHAYPTQLRGTATGFSLGVGRLGSVVGSAMGGWLLASIGVSGYFAVIAVPLILGAAATILIRSARPLGKDGREAHSTGQER